MGWRWCHYSDSGDGERSAGVGAEQRDRRLSRDERQRTTARHSTPVKSRWKVRLLTSSLWFPQR